MRVLVTGHRGYIGSVLVRVLGHSRFEVVGLDTDLYRGCDFGRVRETIPDFDVDIRQIEVADLVSFDAVIHLAAAPDAAYDSLGRQSADQINVEATLRLADCCKAARVSRFLFASTCRVYESRSQEECSETAPVAPRSAAALAKHQCEQYLLRLADRAFVPAILRQADVYGVSPRLRLDLVTNALVASAVTRQVACLNSDGAAWRPQVHVGDLARVYSLLLTAEDEKVNAEVFNVVAPDENQRLIELADLVAEHIPRCTRSTRRQHQSEPSYRADGRKLRDRFPQFAYRWTLTTGIRQLQYAMENAGLTPSDIRSNRFHRTQRLRDQIERGRLDRSMRHTSAPSVP